ncbi:MAG: hypothetical protein Q8N51_09740 [Gammaproteobacteria bacterium]|nr:hypothetical protein [Gammaproteobacteria bacterium]
MAKQNWDVKAFVAGQLAEGKTNLDGARKRVVRLESALQQAFLQLGQDQDLQQQMGTVMGRLQELKGSLDGVSASLDAKLPHPAADEG